ncbi:PDZ domain-containing protein [Streptomyces sp. NPDC047002]|uniref:YlbL family protein n=1 Tax=Streptomyces sp. NPDC047002 TaxID=3155475 RepID=UPI0034539DD9
MPRRTVTMLASTLVLIALLCVGVLTKVPYAEMSPGPTTNTLSSVGGKPVLQVSGRKTYPTSGHLNMVTVRVTSADTRLNMVEAVYGWLAHDQVVVPHDTLYPDGQTEQQSTQENAEEFSESQESAKVSALRLLHIPFVSHVDVASVLKGSPAEGTLHAGDLILAVDGTKVTRQEQVAQLVTKHEPGQDVTFTVVPAEQAAEAKKADKQPTGGREVVVKTATSHDQGKKRAIVGIAAGTDHTFPFSIDIKLADVGGPSAGLMFSLGLVDKLTPGSLTGGSFVAGTGTIDDSGAVGPIGGIAMKLVGARDAGARYFLTPADNCAAAAADTPSGLTLVKVKNISDAKASLDKIRTGDTAGLPRCSAG